MENASVRKPRPKHLDLPKIRLPIPGIVSILHRVSGVIMFLLIPLVLYLYQGMLGSPESFEAARQVAAHPLVKLILIGLVWALLHHLLAGLRFLALDVHLGLELQTTRLLSKLVLGVSLALTAVFAGVLLS